MEITSIHNANVKAWMKLKEKKGRDKARQFIVEGRHLIEEAYRANCLRCLILLKGIAYRKTKFPVYEVSEEIIRKLTSLTSKETMLGILDFPKQTIQKKERLILLDDVQDPGNLGTIIRTAISFGYDALLMTKGCADVFNEKVIRSTQGGIFHLPILRDDIDSLIQFCKQEDVCMYATSLHQAKHLHEVKVSKPYVLVFGNEGSGVGKQVLDSCDETIKIPMEQFESLNVAVAAGICMYAFRYGPYIGDLN